MDFLLAAVNPGYLAAFKGAKLPAAERAAGYDEQVGELLAQMKILDGHLAGKSYLALDRLTLADIALAPVLGRCRPSRSTGPRLPALEGWFAGISAAARVQGGNGMTGGRGR